MIITVDFETLYDKTYSLSKMTVEEYVRDDRFEVIGVGIKVDDAETVWFSGTKDETRKHLRQYDWANSLVLAHNTMFDGAIMSWHFGITSKGWLDTLCMARAIHGVDAGGSLKALAERYEIGQKGDEVINALGKRRADFNADDLGRYGAYCCNDVDLTYKLFNILAQSFPKKELKVIDTTLKMFIEPELELDTILLEQHLIDVKTKKEKLLEAAAADKEILMSNDKFAELLKTLGVDPPTKISARTGKQAWAFAKTDEEFKALTEHPDTRVQALVAARLGNKTTLEETRTQRFIDISKRGKLPVPLRYYGARTGRWAASDSINMQNIPRTSKLKAAICAPDGFVIVGADLSNIELRVGLWLAGQQDKLALLGAGHDLYKDFAASVFNVPYDEVTKDQRFIGKTSQLSLIYGVGAKKLQAAVKTGSGNDIGEDSANDIVRLYRETYVGVVDMWRRGSDVLESVLTHRAMNYGNAGFFSVDGANGVLLPSGLYMQYPNLQKNIVDNKTQWTYAVRNGRDKIYGAKVFQGLTQATARCIIAEHMLHIQKRFRVALTVHDALYLIVPETQAQEALDFTLGVMRTAPEWMPDIPLDAEAGYGKTLADC
jgi:DNA polymerase I-like protein with 3'-5' exonuclease and polymerase domains